MKIALATICGGVAGWLFGFALIVGDWSLMPDYLRWPAGELNVFVHLFGLLGAPLGGLLGFIILKARRPRAAG